MTADTLNWILIIALVETAIAVVFLFQRRIRSKRLLGQPLQRSAAARGVHVLIVGIVFLAAASFWLGPVDRASAATLRLPSLALLFGGALVLLLGPDSTDRALGTSGVRSGWTTAGFGEFEEWRLVGEHLRFRLNGRLWDAVGAAPALHLELRAKLEQLAPARESRYTE